MLGSQTIMNTNILQWVGKRPSNGSGLDEYCCPLDRTRLLRSLIDIQNLYLADT